MKIMYPRLLVTACAFALACSTVMAQFTPGRVVVLQAVNTANGGAGTLVEFTAAGPSGYTVALPNSGATDSGTSIVFGNSSTLNHDLSLSADGALIIVPGYGSTASGVDAATTVNRVVSTVKYNGTYARPITTTSFTTAFRS